MLNEAYAIWRSLDSSKIPFDDYVPGFDRCKEEDGVRVFLREGGEIKNLEVIPSARISKIHVCNLSGPGITLPVFNFVPYTNRVQRM